MIGRVTDLDRHDREQLVLAHVGLARQLARSFARGDRELLEDLQQVAALGLVLAASRFDTARGVAFASYAAPTIVGELRRHFRATRWAAHVPRRLQEAVLEARRAELDLTAERGRAPRASEVAERLGWALEDLLEARAAANALGPVSLDAAAGADDESASVVDRLGADDPGYGASELRDELDHALATLDPPAEAAVRLRFGEELTFGEVAERLGVSPSHASTLVRQAIGRLGTTMRLEAA